MFHVETIASFDDPRLLPYRNMRRQYDHAEQEIFIAEGDKVIRRLLESDLEIISLLFPPRWLEEYKPLIRRRSEKLHVFTAEKDILQNLTGFAMYQGVLGVAKTPRPALLDDILRKKTSAHFFVAVDGISNPENMGGLVRNCAAFGAEAIIVGETCCTPYLRRAVRSAMGTIFKLPFVQPANLAETMRELRQQGIRCVAAHPHTDKRTIYDADFSGDCCVVLGAEGTGISPEVLRACDEAVAIPMSNEVDSLNVGAAAAVFLFEVARQRHGKEGS